MREFSELGVKLERRFEGERIRIEKIEGDTIVIIDFEIRQSKLKRANFTDVEGGAPCFRYSELSPMFLSQRD